MALALAIEACEQADDQQVVRIWHTESNPAKLVVMREIIADYENLNPGIKIERQAVGWSSLAQRLQAALAAGAPPDASHGIGALELWSVARAGPR